MATAVTPSGVRDGDPAALAGLCDARGPAVLAYCAGVAGDAAAPAAAAEAFGAFRAAVYAAKDAGAVNPEALLVNATRHAAARHAAIVAEGICGEVPLLLAARADRTIMLADLDRLEQHLETCWTCRAPVERFKAAERAYRDPPDRPVPPEAAEAIVAALTAAAPVRAPAPPAPKPPARPLRAAPAPAATPAPTPTPAAAPTPAPAAINGNGDVPTTQLRALADIGVDDPAAEPEDHADPATAARPVRPRRGPRPKSAVTPVTVTQLPRPQRSGGSSRRSRGAARPVVGPPGAMRPPVLVPVALVAFAVLIALFVSGVFGANDPTPTSGTGVLPATAPPPPTATKKPEIVVVPGAEDATGAAVERAKSRARSRGGHARKPAAKTPAARAPAAPPPAAATPAPVAAAPPPPPAVQPKPARTPKRPSKASGPKPAINANNGATGAEQLPQEQDTSTVPELTPPPDPVLDPPG